MYQPSLRIILCIVLLIESFKPALYLPTIFNVEWACALNESFNHNFLLLQKILHIYLINTLLTQETFYKYFSQDLESPCKEETSHESPRSQFSWVSSIDSSTAAHSGASSLAKYFRVESHILVSIYTYTIPGILVIDCRWQLAKNRRAVKWQIPPYESQNKPKSKQKFAETSRFKYLASCGISPCMMYIY